MDGKSISNISDSAQTGALALKEQSRDILLLARRFIKAAEEQVNTGHKELSKEAEEFLLSQDWKGNEREIEIAVKRACILSEGQVIKREDFVLRNGQVQPIGICGFIEERLKGFMRNIKNLEKFNLYDTVIPEVEKALIMMVMKETKGNQTKASKLLGINRNTLRDKIKKLRIKAKS